MYMVTIVLQLLYGEDGAPRAARRRCYDNEMVTALHALAILTSRLRPVWLFGPLSQIVQ